MGAYWQGEGGHDCGHWPGSSTVRLSGPWVTGPTSSGSRAGPARGSLTQPTTPWSDH